MGPKYRNPNSSNNRPGSSNPFTSSWARPANLCTWSPMCGILPNTRLVSSVIRSKNSPVMVRFRYAEIAPTFLEMDIWLSLRITNRSFFDPPAC